MSLLAFKDDHQARFQADADSISTLVNADANASSSTVSLAQWAALAMVDPGAHDEPEETLLKWLGPGSPNRPVEWCGKRRLPLGPKLSDELKRLASSGRAEDLGREPSFVLGAALMEAALNDPRGSEGLTLPLKMAGHLGNGMAWVGAEQRLSKFAATQHPAIVSEIDSEIARWAANPLGQKRVLDTRFIQGDLEAWKTAVGLEQALGSGHSDGMLHTDLATVLMAIARTAPDFVAIRLDKLAHPTVVKAVLDHRFKTDETVLLALLRAAPTIADSEGTWNHRFAARLIVDELEDRCEQVLSEDARVRRVNGLPPPTHEDVGSLVGQLVPLMMDVLLARPDCSLLVSEWLAHLVAAYVGRAYHQTGNQLDMQLSAAMVFLDQVGKSCASSTWAQPWALWKQFGGDPGAVLVSETGKDTTEDRKLEQLAHPAWINGRGQRDCVTPVLVAVQFATDQKTRAQDDLVRWMETIVVGLQGEPYLFQLGRQQSALIAAYLAWPLGKVNSPSSHMADLWDRLTKTRLLAKSSPTQESTDYVDCCTAVAMIGIAAILANKDAALPEQMYLAHLVSNIVDEIRFSLPGVGLNSWGTLSGRLAATMADSGLLTRNVDAMEDVLERYLGDDEGLVYVLVNIARDPVDRHEVGQVLNNLGVELQELTDRWLLWNRREALGATNPGARKKVQESEFDQKLIQLLKDVSPSGPL